MPAARRSAAARASRIDRHLPALDGLRGVAILCVLARHLTADLTPLGAAKLPAAVAALGWAGVDLFFALSGYLITSILLETRGAPGYARSFYARRALRIWPLYLLVVAALAVTASMWASVAPADARAFRDLGPWYWTHTLNLRLAADGLWSAPYRTNHLWSLAVEEQFYLGWPLVVAWCPPRRLATLCLTLAGGSVALRVGLDAASVHPLALYVLPVTHLDPLALGGALAAAAAGHAPGIARAVAWVRALSGRTAVVGVALTVAALLALSPSGAPDPWPMRTLGWPLLAVVSVAAVARAAGTAAGWLAARPLQAIGVVSYGVYLLHEPVHWAVRRAVPGASAWAVTLAVVSVTGALAWASWRWWEGPWLSLKRHVPRPVPPLSASSRVEVSHRVRVG